MRTSLYLMGVCLGLISLNAQAQNLVSDGDFGPGGGACASIVGPGYIGFDPPPASGPNPLTDTWMANPTWTAVADANFDGDSNNCYAKFDRFSKVRLIQGFEAPMTSGDYAVSFDYIYEQGDVNDEGPYFWVLGVNDGDRTISRFPVTGGDGFPDGSTSSITDWTVLYQHELEKLGSAGNPVSVADTFSVSSTFDYWVVVVSYGCGPHLSNPTCGDSLRALDNVVIERAVIPVAVDVKPTSCPNPVNTQAKGVISVAVLGTHEFDVYQIDPATVRLEGIPPLRWSVEDVGTPYIGDLVEITDCNELAFDGYYDLVLKFKSQELVAALGPVNDGDVLILNLTGNLKAEFGGTPIEGSDVIWIINKK